MSDREYAPNPPLLRLPLVHSGRHIVVNVNHIMCVDVAAPLPGKLPNADECMIRFASGDSVRIAKSVDDVWDLL